MLVHAEELQSILAGKSRTDIDEDSVLRRAVERLIEIVGEAARKVDATTRAAHPHINWRGIEAQRHVLAHEYGDIDLDKIWRVATIHIPSLINDLRVLVGEPPSAPTPEA
jgi:uncharacterized protein with HEPN domain